MQASLDSLVDAFSRLDRRPAVFDREIRRHVGLWTLAEPVPVADVVGAFKQHGSLTDDGTRVVVPLHEEDSAELTGEYLVYRPDQLVPCMAYHEFSDGGLARIPFDEFGSTFPAWRLRFFHPDYEPPSPPTYADGSLDVTATEGDAGAAGGSTLRAAADLVGVGGSGGDDDVSSGGSGHAAAGATDGGAALGAEEGSGASTPVNGGSPGPAGAVEASADEVIESLRGFVEREREAARAEARARFDRLSPEEYRRTAGGIPDLVPAGIDIDEYGQQSVRVRIPSERVDGPVDVTDEYGIYPGSEVLVGAHEDQPGFPAEAEVLEIEGRELSLGVYWNRTQLAEVNETAFELESDNRFSMGELLNPVPFDRELDAIDAVAADDRKRGVLAGETELSVDSALDVSVDASVLNDDQYRAAMNALRSNDVYCVHGPPGTGKTRTLVEIIRAACADGKRVLACAHSNQAVDNLLVGDSTPESADESSLHAAVLAGDLTAARVGNNSTNALVENRYADVDSYQSDVVCATTSAAHRFGEELFDLAVVDEATQATTPATMLPFSRAKSMVLAGDHKQLPPYRSSERSDDEEMEVSLFERLLGSYGDEVVTTLRTQYRMNEDIAGFPNREFYGGRLTHGVRNRIWSLSTFFPLEAYDVTGEERSTPGDSLYNEREVEVVLAEIERLLAKEVPPSAIGVITPYAGQASKIRGKLATLGGRRPGDGDLGDELMVDTVDSFQGSERDVVIISFVRSNPQGWSGFLEFPTEGPRRLNVALTRARKRCVLVGDFETLATRAPDREPAESAADVYGRLVEYLEESDAFATPPSR